MSRAYRIRVSESLRKVICAEDHVSTQLELLAILPVNQMAELLGQQLVKRGFAREGDQVSRAEGDVKVSVDLKTGTVEVRAQTSEKVELKGKREGLTYGDTGQSRKAVEKDLRSALRKELEQDAEHEREKLQQKLTGQLEAELADLRRELDQAVNAATAEALKQKAAQLGQIKHLTEDLAAGSLTIVIEV